MNIFTEIVIIFALMIFLFGREFGKYAAIKTIAGIFGLITSLFVGGGLIFLAIAGRFI